MSRRASIAAVLVLTCLPPLASAQPARSAALLVEPADAALEELARALLEERGYSVASSGAVEAALAFAPRTGEHDAESVARLREALGVELLLWLRVRPSEEDPSARFFALHSIGGAAPPIFGRALPEQLADRVRAALSSSLASAGTQSAGTQSAGTQSAGTQSAGTQSAGTQSAGTQSAGTQSAGTQSANTETSAPPSVSSVATISPDAAPHQAGEPPLERASPPPPAAPPEPRAPPEPVLPARLLLGAIAGIAGYGYGLGARIDLPLFGVLSGTPDGMGIGFELAATFDVFQADFQHQILGFQLPLSAYWMWRIGAGDVELGPRVGVTFVSRFGSLEGPLAGGFRLEGVLGALVGIYGILRVSSSIGLFAGLDLFIFTDVSGVITVGVAL